MTFSAVTLQLLEGFGLTVALFAATLVLSLPLGLIVTFGSLSKIKPIHWLARTFVWIIRGTPLMLQVMVVFYVPGLMFDYPMESRFVAVLIAFVINYSCYFSEIYRGGIESISKGQYEAAQVLGMTGGQTFFRIILPQVVKRILSPMSNEVITLVKDTSLARTIAVPEIIQVAYRILGGHALVWPLFYSGAFYLIFVGLLTVLFRYAEKKLSYYKV